MRGILTQIVLVLVLCSLTLRAQQAQQIVEEYLQRHGMMKTAQWQSLHYYGVSQRSLRPMPFRYWMQPPNRYRMEVDMGGASMYVQAFDGQRAWEVNPYSPMEGPAWLPESRLPVLSKNYFSGRLAFIKEHGYRLQYVGSTKHQGKDVHHVRLITTDNIKYDFFFNQRTRELVKYSDFLYSLAGSDSVRVEVVPGDYRDFEGVRLPYQLTFFANGQRVKKDSIIAYQRNVPVDVSYPAQMATKAKTFGFDPAHPSERKLLDKELPVIANNAPQLADANGKLLKPVTLTYEGTHRGLHPDWVYNLTFSVTPGTWNNEPVWKVVSGLASTSRTEAASTIISQDDLQLREDHAGFYEGDFTYTVEHDSLVLNSRNRWTQQNLRVALPAKPGVFSSGHLDLYITALPLSTNFQRDFTWLYGSKPRPFNLRVAGSEKITTPAGSFDTYVVELTPKDGMKELQSVYYVQKTAPHIIVRKKYVVFPESRSANMPKSMGNEELTAIQWLKQ